MSDFLQTILARKRAEIEAVRQLAPEEQWIRAAARRDARRPFFEKLASPGPSGVNIIAEIKRASPSRGEIKDGVDPAFYARAYGDGGAAAISVLTERTYFKGSPEDLKAARAAADLPVLRKDFLISTYQIYESAAMGADAVLLIVRALTPLELCEYLGLCDRLGLDALVEVHSEEELDAASEAGALLIGINNRDLTTFKTDLATSERLVKRLSAGQAAVAESGIGGREDIERLLDSGIWNFLIGESIMRAKDPALFIRGLLGRAQ